MAKGKTATRQKKSKKGGPKKALSAFMFFSKARRTVILQDKPELRSNITEISKIIGAEWRNLSSDDKAPYLEEQEADKERYAREKADYDIQMGEKGEEEEEEAAPKKRRQPKKQPRRKVKDDSDDDDEDEDQLVDDSKSEEGSEEEAVDGPIKAECQTTVEEEEE